MKTMKNQQLKKLEAQRGGIALPAILWWMGVPLTLLVILWLLGMF
jgi:hypothetical protein